MAENLTSSPFSPFRALSFISSLKKKRKQNKNRRKQMTLNFDCTVLCVQSEQGAQGNKTLYINISCSVT